MLLCFAAILAHGGGKGKKPKLFAKKFNGKRVILVGKEKGEEKKRLHTYVVLTGRTKGTGLMPGKKKKVRRRPIVF